MQAYRLAVEEEKRALANWDPSYESEKVNFYQEFIHRHAPIKLSWYEGMSGTPRSQEELREATGVGVLYGPQGNADKLYAPLDDGSIGVWDATPADDYGRHPIAARMLSKTSPGFLTAQRSGGPIVRETGVVESVSIDREQQRGFFAVDNGLIQVDLNTLQITSRDTLVWPIHAVSEARHPTPLTVGTSHHLYLVDPRDNIRDSLEPPARIDQIGGPQLIRNDISTMINTPPPNYAVLSQPGPLSIIHLAEDRPWDGNGDIWVAGRFTHLLNYDRRFFPKLRGTIHSGARISSMIALPFPLKQHPSNLSLAEAKKAKETPGTTIVAAGEYKGKGSLELYGLSSEPEFTTFSSDSLAGFRRSKYSMTGGGSGSGNCALNRQTASSSKLLSVASHGMKLVYSDGDAKLKWVERNGFTPVREYSINPAADAHGFVDSSHEDFMDYSVFNSNPETDNGDIVQKIVPTLHRGILSSSNYEPLLHDDNLIIWTGDGRLGMVGFGKQSAWDSAIFEENVATAEDEAKMKQERQYGLRMREALQWHADEARFMSGLGLPLQ